jgi:selenocysteine-specific elongation factor
MTYKDNLRSNSNKLQAPLRAAKHLVLGIIGHVDHGKTALVRALTGEETDRLEEEKRRGISIALGFARLNLGAQTIVDLIDMPGHERFVRTMISGATGMDAVLLAVAANEGIKPQTIEHIDIAALLGLRRAALVITKADLVSEEQARGVAAEVGQLMRRCGLEPLPAVMTSAQQGTGIEALRQTLRALAADQDVRAADGLLYLPIDRAFSIAGHGPVVTGTLRGAGVAPGDTLELWPARQAVRVRAVQLHGEQSSAATPGQRVALNLRDVEIAALGRGMALAAPGALALSAWLTIAVRAVTSAPPLKNGARLRVLLGTDERDVRLRLLDRDVLEPGESALAQLRCADAIAVPAREHLILRVPSPPRTVAGGKVLDANSRRLQRHNGQVLQRLQQLRALAPASLIAAEVERAGFKGATLRHLSQLSALALPRVIELIRALPVAVTRSGSVLLETHMNELLARIPALLAKRTELSQRDMLEAFASSAEVLDEVLGVLLARGMIAKRGARFVIPQPQEDQARARDEADLAARIAEALRQAGLSPPNPNTLITDVRSKRAIERLLRERIIVRALDEAKGKEILFHQEAIEYAKGRLGPLLERPPGLLVTEIGALLGISRKFTVPLLGHLDTIRFTRRINDRRVRA